MNHKIGDYIHYHYENYLKYGLGTKENPDITETAQQAYTKQKNLISKQADKLGRKFNKDQVKKELEDTLNYFRPDYQAQNITNWTENEKKAIAQVIENIVQEKIGAEFRIDFNTMQVMNINSSEFQRVGGDTLRKKLSESGTNSIESVNQRIEVLDKTLNDVYKMIETPKAELLRNKLLQLSGTWKDIQNGLGKKYKKGVIGEVIKHNNIGFIKDLNEMWNSFKREVSSYATGVIGEYYAAIAVQALQLKGQNITKELLDDFVKGIKEKSLSDLGMIGSQSSTRVYSSKYFSATGKGNNHFQNQLFRDFSGGKFSIEPKQDKVDLQINLSELQKINASIKNYNFSPKSMLSVHSGSSILALTQEYTDFMNHYLNVTARTGGIQNYSQANVELKPMNQTLKMTLALKAISGGILKLGNNNSLGFSQQAEVLILNDNSGLYKVYWVDELFNRIINNVNTYLEISGLTDNTTWQQSWVVTKENTSRYQAAYARINRLLSQLHSFQLKISIKPKIFQD